jgi:hypothetical protein
MFFIGQAEALQHRALRFAALRQLNGGGGALLTKGDLQGVGVGAERQAQEQG